MKIFGYVVLVLIGFFILGWIGVGLGIIRLPLHSAQNSVQTARDLIDETINADNAIYNYEWFKQQKEDIDALGRKYNNAADSYDFYVSTIDGAKTFEDKTEIARLNTVKLGIKNQLEQAIANYNARAKMANRSIFQDSLVPDYLDTLLFIKR